MYSGICMRFFITTIVLNLLYRPRLSDAFSLTSKQPNGSPSLLNNVKRSVENCDKEYRFDDTTDGDTRRSFLTDSASVIMAATGLWQIQPSPSDAAVGSLPELSDTNAILQSITINVADKSQQDAMIRFLMDAFDFQILRQIQVESNYDTFLGFGPEVLKIPNDFTMGVSSFAKYGGHASIHIRLDAESKEVYYRNGDNPPGDNIAFLQVGVPTYRISQMVKNSGNVIDAYGFVNVVSPSGLPMRGIVGIHPDPMMFVAINCQDVQKSREFYKQLGFTEVEYPYARPAMGTSPFEPAQPKNSIYMSQSPNCMGVLLLQSKDKKRPVKPNNVLRSMNIVYTPSSEVGGGEDLFFTDPSGVNIAFQTSEDFEKELIATKVK